MNTAAAANSAYTSTTSQALLTDTNFDAEATYTDAYNEAYNDETEKTDGTADANHEYDLTVGQADLTYVQDAGAGGARRGR